MTRKLKKKVSKPDPEVPPGFLDGYKTNFETMLSAARTNALCLLECYDSNSSEPTAVVCATYVDGEGSMNFVPIARMFDGNPYDYIRPPKAGGGFHPLDTFVCAACHGKFPSKMKRSGNRCPECNAMDG